MTEKIFEGVFTALITPFQSGEIDWPSLKKLVRFQLDAGIKGFVVRGTTGESPTLNFEEVEKIFKFLRVEAGHDVQIVVGTGTNSTRTSVEYTLAAKGWGADGALVVVPYYNKPSQEGLYAHFKSVAELGKLPVILYNVPSRTITKLEFETIRRLSDVRGVWAIKEASGDLVLGREIAMKAKNLTLLSGDDGTCFSLAREGGRGVISVMSHILPKQMIDWSHRAIAGESESVQKEFLAKYGELNTSLYVEANPIPIKYALWKMGIISSPELRLPLTALDKKHHGHLDRLLEEGGLI